MFLTIFGGFFLQAIAKFESLVNQIQKNAKDINQRLQMIENANLFKGAQPKYPDMLPSCKVGYIIITNFAIIYKIDQNRYFLQRLDSVTNQKII